MDEMIGRVDMLETRAAIEHWKARGLDFSAILYNPPVPSRVGPALHHPQDHGLDRRSITSSSIMRARPSTTLTPIEIKLPIRNVHRTVGAMLSGEIARRYGSAGLAGRHHQIPVHGLGRAELWRVPRQRRHARTGRRRQRLRGQGAFGRAH